MKRTTSVIVILCVASALAYANQGNSKTPIPESESMDNLKKHSSADLSSTMYCDFEHLNFQNVPNMAAHTARNTALKIFSYVRDEFTLGYDEIDVKASETLKKERGTCWNKALLMAALLRKNSIPCKIVYVLLKKEFLKPLETITPVELRIPDERIPDPVHHFFVQVHLGDKWIHADPSLDKASYEKAYKPLYPPWNIDWDGKTDHIIHTKKMVSPVEIVDDIDDLVARYVAYRDQNN